MMDASALKGVGGKLVAFVVWTVISLALSYVAQMVASSQGVADAMAPHEKAVEACVIAPESIEVTLGDVGGLETIKEELHYSLLLPLRHPSLFFRAKAGPFSASRGLLLAGPPGCGKTMLMKAVAKTCGCCFLCPTLATLQSKYYGESQKMLAAMFAVARRRAPCILFLDEIDAAFRARSEEDASCDYTLKTEFLSLMDGMRTRGDEAVVVVGATNNPDALDPALKRRLPTVIRVSPPEEGERRQIAALACRYEPKAEGSAKAFSKLEGKETEGMSGSDLAEVYRCASRRRLRAALRKGARPDALEQSLPALSEEDWRKGVEQCRSAKREASVSHCSAPSSSSSRIAKLVQALGGAATPKRTEQA